MSFYYTPDLCAGSFRAAALIQAMQSVLPAGSHIDVLTTLPNRYSSFNASAPEIEAGDTVAIRRIALPEHKSGMLDQSRAFIAYARGVRAHVRERKYDLVFATSSRLMTAVLGASIARNRNLPLYLDIRDIFVDTIKDILPRWLAWPMGSVFSLLERYAVGHAGRVNLVSRGFEPYFSKRYPTKRLSFFTNGIDDEFIVKAQDDKPETKVVPPYSVLYAGNLGEGQGLHVILPGLARAMNGQAKFTVIGDGGRKLQLKQALDTAGVDNVSLVDPVNRSALVQAYQEADVLFLHLNDHDAFRKVLPSKVFEYAAVGKPVWAGVAGYAAEFIEAEIGNAAVFEPCDVASAVRAFSTLNIRATPRPDFIRKYARRNIMQRLAEDVVSFGLGRQL
ncbi:MAG: glycosyltransferase family 4 protein [Thiobacillus sp.]|nr:glycosyltransferase family 4 protein [Thiobacillus sp.]